MECKRFPADAAGSPRAGRGSTATGDQPPAGQGGPRNALEAMLSELGDEPTVVHHAAVFLEFLEASNLHPPRQVIDSRELAEIVLPRCSDYSLASVAGELHIEPPEMPGSPGLARLTRSVWDALVVEMRNLPGPALVALSELAMAADSPLADVLGKAADKKAGFVLSDGGEPGLGSVFKNHERIFKEAQQFQTPERRDAPVDTQKICAMFAKDGAVGRNLGNFEPREEQIGMAESVCDALNHGRHLMCEAGTGIGKSMAYLLPIIAWARQNDDKVIVSTNTKNLQEQLHGKDLPFLKKLLGGRFQTALLKGRSNYLCVRRFLNLIRYHDRELSAPQEAAAVMPLVGWATSTRTGDISECSAFLQQSGAGALSALVTAGGDECMGRGCRYINKCFVRRARALAQLSDIIVVNHALAFADVALDRPHLPRERCIVFDEAHNIEDVATEAVAVDVDSFTFYRICRRLWRRRRDGSGVGMVSTLIGLISKHLPESGALSRETALEMAQGVVEGVEELGQEVRGFFDMLSGPFDPLPPAEDKILLDRCRPEVTETGLIGETAARVDAACRKLQERVKNLVECLEENSECHETIPEFAMDLAAQNRRLRDAAAGLEFILKREGENHVYWLQRSGGGRRNYFTLRAAPLEVGDFMRTFFFDEMRSVIMTSATLRVEGGFDYIKERLGAGRLSPERLSCAAFGSPFDFARQTRLCVPTFLPDAGGRRDASYDEELSSFLIDLLRGTAGRSLVLFTSYSLLNKVYERIKRPLEGVGVPLLAQGRDGSRRSLTARFKENIGSVLLGTQSFWEGVDVLGESLSCLVVTKLPFHVFTDPLVQGRIQHLRENHTDPFRHYTLPEAVINFRQGFGRLIRHRTDRGVVVVTDRRLVTKSYGRSFLSDLSTPHRVYKRREELINDVQSFLEKE